MKKFNLGPSSIDFNAFLVTPRTGRKRSVSQSKLENFNTPNGTASNSIMSPSTMVPSGTKKSRPSSLSAKKSTPRSNKKGKKRGSVSSKKATPTSAKGKKNKKKPKKGKKMSKSASTPATLKSPPITLKSSSSTPKSHSVAAVPQNQNFPAVTPPPLSPSHPTKSPRSKAEALKLLNKAKRFKQMDLKKSVVKKNLTPEQLVALKELKERDRQRKAEEERKKKEDERRRKEEERRRKEEERKERKEEERKEREEERRRLKEERMKTKLRELEWLKPREDLACEDSLVSKKNQFH